jgi:hypothetical protein
MPGKLRQADNNWLTIGRESSFGTPVPATRFIKQTGATTDRKVDYVQSKSQLGTRLFAGSFPTTAINNLSVPFEADPYNLQVFLQAALGQEVTSAGVTGQYIHTFTPANTSNLPSYTPYISQGNYKVYSLPGATLDSMGLDISPKQVIQGTSTWIALTEVDQSIQITGAPAGTVLTTSTAHGFAVGDKVRLFVTKTGTSTGILPTPFVADTDYYVIDPSAGTSLTLSDSPKGTAITIETAFTAPIEVVKMNSLEPPTTRPFVYNDVKVQVNGSDSFELQNIKLNFANNIYKDDFRAGLAGQVASFPAGQLKTSGSFQLAFDEYSYFLRQAFLTGTNVSLNVTATSTVPCGSGFMSFTLTLPSIQITDAKVSGSQLSVACTFDVVGTYTIALANDVVGSFA